MTVYDSLAEIYDVLWQGQQDDIKFYYESVKNERQPTLELGCGTGRIAIPLACAGLKVVGLDISNEMLSSARKKLANMGKISGNIRLEQQDMRDFTLPEKFGSCIIPFRSFLHLITIKDQEECLKNIYNHLKAQGKLILNMFVPNLKWIVKGRVKSDKKTAGIGADETLEYWFDSKFDSFNQTIEAVVNICRKGEKQEKNIKQKIKFYVRYIYPFEMYHLLTKCNFKVLNLYGDFNRKEFSPESTEMIWVCEKG